MFPRASQTQGVAEVYFSEGLYKVTGNMTDETFCSWRLVTPFESGFLQILFLVTLS